jgi:hypothetical protein
MVLFGASVRDIQKVTKRHDAEFETDYTDHVLQQQLTGDTPRTYLGLVRRNILICQKFEELNEGQPVTISITYGTFESKSIHVVTDSELQTIYVGDSG